MIMVWKKCKEAVGIGIAVPKLYYDAIRSETLGCFPICYWFWEDAKEYVFLHESVFWFGVTREVVHQDAKIDVSVIRVGLNQSVPLAAIDFFLQLQQNAFLVFEENFYNLLSIWPQSKAVRKETESAPCNFEVAVYFNWFSIWHRINFVHTAHRSWDVISNFYTAPVTLMTATKLFN